MVAHRGHRLELSRPAMPSQSSEVGSPGSRRPWTRGLLPGRGLLAVPSPAGRGEAGLWVSRQGQDKVRNPVCGGPALRTYLLLNPTSSPHLAGTGNPAEKPAGPHTSRTQARGTPSCLPRRCKSCIFPAISSSKHKPGEDWAAGHLRTPPCSPAPERGVPGISRVTWDVGHFPDPSGRILTERKSSMAGAGSSDAWMLSFWSGVFCVAVHF